MFLSLLKLILTRLLSDPDKLRTTLIAFLGNLAAAAEATATKIDDVAVSIVEAIVGDDALWATFADWLTEILNDRMVKALEGANIEAVLRADTPTMELIERVSEKTGIGIEVIIALIIQYLPTILEWWRNRRK